MSCNRLWVTKAISAGSSRFYARQPGQVVACVVGGRGEVTCRRLWHTVPTNYRQGVVYSDFWRAYQAVIPDEQHQAVGKETGLTNHVERFNNFSEAPRLRRPLRQRLARFVRKTLSFSKSNHLHLICLHTFLVRAISNAQLSVGDEPLPDSELYMIKEGG